MKIGDSIRVINVVYAFRIVIKIEKINFSEFRFQIVFVHSISMERYIMKILGVMGLLLSNIVLANHEIKFDDIWNFKISVTEMKGNRKIHLTGLLGNSAMGISDSKITIHDDELNIVLFEALAKGKYSGDLNKEIIIEKPIKKITFGSDNKVIWQN